MSEVAMNLSDQSLVDKELFSEELRFSENKTFEPFLKTDCEHFFVFEERTKNATCLRTNEISNCVLCDKKYDDIIHREIFPLLYSEKNREALLSLDKRTPLYHCHIWCKDGRCGSEINFPDMENGENFGYDNFRWGRMSNKNRICKQKRISNK